MASQRINEIMESLDTAKEIKRDFKKDTRPALLALIEDFKTQIIDMKKEIDTNSLAPVLIKLNKLNINFASYVYNKDKAGALNYKKKIEIYVATVVKEFESATEEVKDALGDVLRAMWRGLFKMMKQLDRVIQADVIRKREKEQAAKKAKAKKGKKGRK